MNKKFNICLIFTVAIASPNVANSLGFEILVPHRAVYDVTLIDSSKRSGIKSMQGRIVYELRGNECEGISLKYRFLTRVSTGKDEFLSDQHTSTYESADGKNFSFDIKSFLNEQLEENTSGRASLTSTGLSVILKKPKPQTFEFTKARFLSSYLVKLIELAGSGEHFLRSDLYDGSEGGDETIVTSSVISKEKSVSDAKDLKADLVEKFSGKKAWAISMSYFDKGLDATSEHLPIYESSFLLFDNGISTDLVMRYPDYTLEGKLVELEEFTQSACKKDG